MKRPPSLPVETPGLSRVLSFAPGMGQNSFPRFACPKFCHRQFLFTSLFNFIEISLPSQQSSKEEYEQMRYYRKVLRVSYKDHVTNKEDRAKIQQAIGPHEDLLTIVGRHKLQWYVMPPVHQVWPKPSCNAQ